VRAIRISEYGGPEVLKLDEVPAPGAGAGEALVRVRAAGVNFIDVYQRTGRYPLSLPFTPGNEAAGTVEAVGEGVDEVRVGDRVAFAMQLGAYAELVALPAWKLVALPEGVDERQAAAAMLQGMTAHYLTHATYPIRRGDTVLVHAAAGGVGLLLCQMAHRLGARVIGTVSTEEKARLAREAGADEVIRYTEADFEEEVRRITDGAGVEAVYDSVGKTTFDKGLNCLKPRGTMALFGASSGAVPPFDPLVLSTKGSLYVTRPTLAHYARDRAELLSRAGDVLGWVAAGELSIRVERTYPLAEAAAAHRDLESRATSGKLLLEVGE
jgi:NADPH2:quinone reductase